MPSARHAVWQLRHQLALVVLGEERRELKDLLPAHEFARIQTLVDVRHVEVSHENLVEHGLRIIQPHSALAHHKHSIVASVGIGDECVHILLGYRIAAYRLALHDAEGAIGGDVSVDVFFYLLQIRDNLQRTSRGNVHPHPMLLCKGDGTDRGLRNLVSIEAHQRTVDIKKQCACLHLIYIIE